MWSLLNERKGRTDITLHGFRSTFKDWASEDTYHPDSISEAALAHAKKDKATATYQRGDLLSKRVSLMQDWADYACNNVTENVREIA